MTTRHVSRRIPFDLFITIFATLILPVLLSCGDGGGGTGPIEVQVGSVTIVSDALNLAEVAVSVSGPTGPTPAGRTSGV